MLGNRLAPFAIFLLSLNLLSHGASAQNSFPQIQPQVTYPQYFEERSLESLRRDLPIQRDTEQQHLRELFERNQVFEPNSNDFPRNTIEEIPQTERERADFEGLIGGQKIKIQNGELIVEGGSGAQLLKPQNRQDFESFMEFSEREGVDFSDVYRRLEPEIRNKYLYEDMLPDIGTIRNRSFTEQVLPGIGIEGPSGPQVCSGPLCGTDRIVFPGQECSEEDCPAGGSSLPSCSGDYCNATAPMDLDVDGDGLSDVAYVKSSYPEVAFLRKKIYGENFTASCTATLISPGYALTALHCFNKSSSIGILDQYKVIDFDKSDDWGELVSKSGKSIGYKLVSDHSSEVALVSNVYIPFTASGASQDQLGYLPSKDIAILKYSGGLKFEQNLFPILGFDELQEGHPISFVGFGWTDLNDNFDEAWATMSAQEKWRELKQAAFNFLDDIRNIPSQTEQQFIWNHGDPPGTGGPCLFDSGGPIYQGFNMGYWHSPRIIVGVVSALHSSVPAGAGENAVDACLSSSSFLSGEIIANYQTGICQITDMSPKGC